MKKTVFIIVIVSALLAMVFAGCQAAQRVPMVTAAESALPTLPPMSPSPAVTAAVPTYGATTTMPSIGTLAPTIPAATMTAGALPTIKATTGKTAKP